MWVHNRPPFQPLVPFWRSKTVTLLPCILKSQSLWGLVTIAKVHHPMFSFTTRCAINTKNVLLGVLVRRKVNIWDRIIFGSFLKWLSVCANSWATIICSLKDFINHVGVLVMCQLIVCDVKANVLDPVLLSYIDPSVYSLRHSAISTGMSIFVPLFCQVENLIIKFSYSQQSNKSFWIYIFSHQTRIIHR